MWHMKWGNFYEEEKIELNNTSFYFKETNIVLS